MAEYRRTIKELVPNTYPREFTEIVQTMIEVSPGRFVNSISAAKLGLRHEKKDSSE